MVVLIALGLSLTVLLIVTMVAMTRYMLANPDDPLVRYDGTWSGALGDERPPQASADDREAVPAVSQARTPSASAQAGVPLDDMPAEVIDQVARRLRGR